MDFYYNCFPKNEIEWDLHCNDDPGDTEDKLKWDFDEESGYNTIYIGSYPYKVMASRSIEKQRRVAKKLSKLRKLNDRMTNIIDDYAKGPDIEIYKYIHRDTNGTSNYLLSEIKPSTGFSGLNKPKCRVKTDDVHVGADKSIRAKTRHIFLTIDPNTDKITKEELELYIHELAHTLANHVSWRPDDHHHDFQKAEKLLWKLFKVVK